jgi:4-diphosphocytidyl-2-C-methyl-D-erythritol kinase
VNRAPAPAKINLSLVVGPVRANGKHKVVSVMAPLELADDIRVEPAPELTVEGFAGDTLVRGALEALASAARTDARWRVTIEKRIPVAAGLGGGSSDAASALRLANETLDDPLPDARLLELAGELGADIPFFLTPGPKLARGDGTTLAPISLPRELAIVILSPSDVSKSSTADVYRAFDERGGQLGFEERAARLEDALRRGDLANLPGNDLVFSPAAPKLVRLGAFRADVTGAGPAVYALFHDRARAEHAAKEIAALGRVWVGKPGW